MRFARPPAASLVYLNYFGLSEASFSITPDPQYLFLSGQHREALAHLLYGAGENGGFVMLTGEVGTGKTTVCRAFLEQVPEQVEVALVLNPAMTAIELMQAICHEFGVEVAPGEASVKALVDRLNDFLLAAHARGRHPVLIIDEAQNLRPMVLEQVRLLTNLETPKHKLLQIFLIGQPELRAMLASPELRQLNQRITARFHLTPLSARETAAYVDHRVTVAGVERPLFSAAALREVYRCSSGVPRLINLLCDRALLGAAVSRRMQVTPAIVRRAARELHGAEAAPQRRSGMRPAALAAALTLALGFGVWFGASGLLGGLDPQLQRMRTAIAALGSGATPAPEPSAVAAAADEPEEAAGAGGEPALADAPAEAAARAAAETGEAPAALPETDGGIPRIALARVAPEVPEASAEDLARLTLGRSDAVAELLRRWGRAPAEGADCERLGDPGQGLRCERVSGRWSDLRLYDRPAALALDLDGGRGYAVVTALDQEFAVLQQGAVLQRVPLATLDARWSGETLMLWQAPPAGTKLIGPGSAGEAVRWLRERFAALPDSTMTDVGSGEYDGELAAAVRRFQRARGLAVDGIAGPRTLILLNNALAGVEVPRLSQAQAR